MKLTIHDACWDAQSSDWANKAIAAKVRWIKVIDDPARAFGVAQAAPACQVIYRKVSPPDIEQLSDLRKHPEFGDALKCAEMFVRLTDVRPAPNLWVEGANEAKLASLDDAQWYGKVEALRSRLLKARGLKCVIGNFATGNPEPPMFAAFMREYWTWGGDPSALIGLHEYGAIHVRAINDGHNLLRHRMLRQHSPGYSWAITECGLDQVKIGDVWTGGGWRAPGAGISETAYWQYMRDFNTELEKDADVVCACIFTYGDTGRWRDYEMDNAQEFNNNLIAAIVADQPAATTPDCTRTDVPDDWTHTVEATAGLRVRSSMSTASLGNVLCSMINGKQVKAVQRIGDWMQIAWPVAGYCWAPNLKVRPPQPTPPKRLGDVLKLAAGDRFVDISAWQDVNDLDFPVLKMHGYRSAMVRLAAGALTDPEWHLYAGACQAAVVPWFGYVWYSLTVSWQSQVSALTTALNKLSHLPTVAIDLESSNPSKGTEALAQYVNALTLMGIPLAVYTRQGWVVDQMPKAAEVVGKLPLIVANYKRPINTTPALPPGWDTAAAWQHASGEMAAPWRFAKTISGKGLDENIVLASGLEVCCGMI